MLYDPGLMNTAAPFTIAITVALSPCLAQSQSTIPTDRAMVAIVGDAELLNVGQAGYCGERTTIDNPGKTKFLIPAGQRTWFFLSSKLRLPTVTLTCSGDYSFVPMGGKLHIFRYSLTGESCLLEHFSADPGKTPQPADMQQEQLRSCLAQ